MKMIGMNGLYFIKGGDIMDKIEFNALTVDNNKVKSIILDMLKKSYFKDLLFFKESDLLLYCGELWDDSTVYEIDYKILLSRKDSFILPNSASLYYSSKDGKYHFDLTVIVIHYHNELYMSTNIIKLHDKFDLSDLVKEKNNEQ